MPTLPTLTINDAAIWTRIFNAFDGDPEVYKAWLKQQLQTHVRQKELMAAQAAVADVNTLLDNAT